MSHSSNIRVIEDENELLQCGICRIKIPDSIDCKKWASELSQVTPLIAAAEDGEFPFYRNIMEEQDFPFDEILLDSEICKAMTRYFEIHSPKDDIRLDDAFCIQYNVEQHDTTGARHTDPSDITINMCMEKTNDAKGSHVLFHGTMPLEKDHDETVPRRQQLEKFLVNQEPGFATIHWGAHPHETTALECGSRTNVILTYCYRDENESQAHKRSCYFT